MSRASSKLILRPLKPKAPKRALKSARLTLRAVHPSMAPTIFEVVDANRAHLARFLPWVPLMKSVEDERRWTERQVQCWKDRSDFAFMIFLRDGTLVGCVDAHHVSWSHHRAELGYWIAREHEGNGYITEAVAALEKALFEIGFHRIAIHCDTTNKRSAAIPKRLGYRLEGVLRHEHILNGRFGDLKIFAKIAR